MTTFTGVESLESVLQEHIPEEKLEEVMTILYGSGALNTIEIPSAVQKESEGNAFEVKGFKVDCPAEQIRSPSLVRVGCIQHGIVLPTTAPVMEQYKAIEKKVEKIIDAAALMKVNVLCLQEAWTCPFFFCTREKTPWCELAEDAEHGFSTEFIKRKAKQHNMVIISPILERDGKHNDTIWNTAVVVGNHGNYIGKSRKNHIPRVGDFNESTYYMEGNTGHPVFVTQFGKIAINICYGRHHPLNWAQYGLNGAELVFNPSATVGALSEPMWFIEARNAAIANGYYTFAINRVGTEIFPNEFTSANGKPAHKDFGHFYGSTYCAAPNAARTPGLSRHRDGLHVTELDLNLCRQVRDKWCLQMTNRLAMYAEKFSKVIEMDYEGEYIRDPMLD